MKTLVKSQRIHIPFKLCLSLAVWVAGCGGANFGSDLSSRPKPTVLNGAETVTTKLPQDASFSIFSASSQKDSGLGGKAEPVATASPDGSADVSADVADGGEASAVFQLGHAFENKSDRMIDLDVVVRFHYEYAAKSSPPGSPVDGSVGLKLYARDDRNRLVRNDELIAHPLDTGPTQSSGDSTHRFTLTLGPGRSVSVFLAGQSQVKSELGRWGNCELRISGLNMEVTTRAAPPARTASDEQG